MNSDNFTRQMPLTYNNSFAILLVTTSSSQEAGTRLAAALQPAATGQTVTLPIYVTFASTAIVTNAIVIVTMLWSKTLSGKTINVFIVNQSCIDFLSAVFILANANVGTNSGLVSGSARDEVWCRIWYPNCPVWMFYEGSIANLQVIRVIDAEFACQIHGLSLKIFQWEVVLRS